ncbi:MAG: NADPH:quinone oxidoreductase family protein [Aurantimonas endophytica]|uniref:NADPH:quinone oxidoreductase family protein n=1 Tax=Aurantimonas endophytica TaxID=1522175 RepID=UPI0030031EFB
MKAIVCGAYGPIETLAYRDMPDPVAGPGEVVVEADAIGVNYPDGLLVQGLYQARPELPFVPGMEVAGRVIAIGADVTRLAVGDRVVASLQFGAYAEKVAVAEAAVTKLPDEFDAGVACALVCAYGTAYHALKQRAALQPDETLLVLGAAGATGLAAVQIGQAMGARVIAVASSEDKRSLAVGEGADVAIGYDDLREDLKRLTDGKGVDVAFDPVGGEAFDAVARSMAWNGRLLVVGFASGTIPKLPVNLALVKGFSAVGVFWGAFIEKEPEQAAANMAELIAWTAEERLQPVISERGRLADAAEILGRIHARQTTGKLILVP